MSKKSSKNIKGNRVYKIIMIIMAVTMIISMIAAAIRIY